jgi:hypothetical protein
VGTHRACFTNVAARAWVELWFSNSSFDENGSTQTAWLMLIQPYFGLL